jgi:hypothetical protein
MKRYLLPLFFLLSCSGKIKEQKANAQATEETGTITATHFIKFSFDDKSRSLEGKSDITSAFYSHNWPDYHTPEHIKETRLSSPNVFCGRMTNPAKDKMIEMFMTFPEGTKLKISDFKKLVGQKIYTDNADPEAIYSRFYFFDTQVEYTSDSETKGYLLLNKITAYTDSTVSVEGSFDIGFREYGKTEIHPSKGTFLLEFYIGL